MEAFGGALVGSYLSQLTFKQLRGRAKTLNIDYSKCTERKEVEELIIAEMNKRGIKKPKSPPKKRPPPSKLNFDENTSPKSSNKPGEIKAPVASGSPPPSLAKPMSPPPFPEVSNASDWNNLNVTPKGLKKKTVKKNKKDKKKEAHSAANDEGAAEKRRETDHSGSRFVNNLMKPEVKPKASKLPPLMMLNKHAKIGISDESPQKEGTTVEEDLGPVVKKSKVNVVTNAFMDAAASRYRRGSKDSIDRNKTVEQVLGMKDINGTVLDEDEEKAYQTNRFMPAKRPKTSQDYFDGSASYHTDEDARLGRHFHRSRKTDKYGWWNEQTENGNITRQKETLDRDGTLGTKLNALKKDQNLVESRSGFLLRSKAPTETDAAIKFYSDQLRKFDRYDFPEEWATCHASMAKLFFDRSKGKRKNNIENGLYHIENSLQVFKSETHPLPWSDLAMMACQLFRERVGLHEQKAVKKLKSGADAAMIDAERSLENAEAALTVLNVDHQPVRYARAQREIAACHMKRFEGEAYHVDEQEGIEVSVRVLDNCIDIFEKMVDMEKHPKKYEKKVKNKMKQDIVLTTVTGEKEFVYPKLELGKAYYTMGAIQARRHSGSIVANYMTSLKYLEKACENLPERSPDWLLANAMLAKSHAGVDAPEAAQAGDDFGETTDNVDTAIKRLNLSLGTVDLTMQKEEYGELHWQIGYMLHLKLRQLKGGDGTGEVTNKNKEEVEKMVETCIDHLSKALNVISPVTAPAPDRYCAIHSVMGATHSMRAEVLTVAGANDMDILEAQATLAQAVGHYQAACSEWDPESYPEQFAVVRSRIGETFVKMGELSKAAHAYRGAMLAAGMMCNVQLYEKELFADKEEMADTLKRPWKVWCKVGGVFEACAEICVIRALIEGGEDRSTIPNGLDGRREKWIFVLDPSEIAENQAKKAAAAEAKRLAEEQEKLLHPLRLGGKKQAGVADWEGVEDQYDATEDMGGEFDVKRAMKDSKKKTKKELKDSLAHMMQQKTRQMEANVFGDDGSPVKTKVSSWKSFIFGGKKEKGKALNRTRAMPVSTPGTPGTLRKRQKDEAIKASGFKGKEGKKGAAPDVPMAPSHIKAPSMPPPASAMLTAAGAIVPMAPKGIKAPKGPPPKAMKSTVEEKFIRAVWNMEDPPDAPVHIRAPGTYEDTWFERMKKKYDTYSASLRLKYEIIMSLGKRYTYDAKVIAHPRALEALHICSRASWVKLVEGCRAANVDTGKRALNDMNFGVYFKHLQKYMSLKKKMRYHFRSIKLLEDEVKKQKNEFNDTTSQIDKGLQWLSKKASDYSKIVTLAKKLEALLRNDIQYDNISLPLFNVVPMSMQNKAMEKEHYLRKVGVPLGSMYPSHRDLLKSIDLYEAKVIWFMSEEGGVQRDTSEGQSVAGDGKVGSQALFAMLIYREMVRFTPLGSRISKTRCAQLDRAERKIHEEEMLKDELEMVKIRQMTKKDARKAMKKRKKRILKRENLKSKGSGYVRVPGDVKVKMVCCEAVDAKKCVEVAVSAYIDATRTKQFHKRGFLLERALKFLSDSLGLNRILEEIPLHVDSLCIIPHGPMRLAPLHALPIPSAGSRMYRGETLNDRFVIRYCTSLLMSDWIDGQAEIVKSETPWWYRKCACVADPVPNHKGSIKQMRLAKIEGGVVKSIWSADDDDTSLLVGPDAHCGTALVSEKVKEGGEVDEILRQEKTLEEKEGGVEGGEGGGGEGGGKKKKKKEKRARAQVMVAEGVWKDLSDSDDSSDDSSDDDEEDDNLNHDHILSVCRCLHLAAPVEHTPEPTVLLAPPPIGSKSGGVELRGGVARMKAKDIMKRLHLQHCGLVFISRGGSAQTATVSSDMSNLKSRRSIGVDASEVFLLAGAQTVVLPLWSDEANALATVLFTIKFYDELPDCADEVRPVAVALKHTSNWLRNATFTVIRNFIWASRVDRLVLEEIDDELWSVALAQKMLRGGQQNFRSGDDRWERVQKDATPFASPFYWAMFRAVGNCGGIHDPRIAERDEFDDFKEDKKFERYLEEFDENEGKVDSVVVKGLKKAKAEAEVLGEAVGEKIAEKAKESGVTDRVEGYKNIVKERIEVKKIEVAEMKEKVMGEVKGRRSRAADAIRNAPKMAKIMLERELAERKKAKRKKLGATIATSPEDVKKRKGGGKGRGKGKGKGKGRGGGGGKGKKKYEDDSDDSSDGGGDDDDYGTPEFGSVAELRRLRAERLKAEENGGSKACSIM